MAVEIKELVIRAVVENTSGKNGAKSGGGGAVDQQQIIEACVEQILKILKKKTQR